MSFQRFLALFVALFCTVSATYIVTCHNNNECGTVCGRYSNDMMAPTEGLFGTSCWCGSGGATTHKCTAFNVDVRVCSDGKAPQCSTACGQQICVQKDNKYTTGTILSACPKNHPTNTQQCCDHPTSKDYCTCVVQDTLDLNADPYRALGNTNGYSQNAWWGACGSTLASLNIYINSTRAEKLVQPFLKSGQWCQDNANDYTADSRPDICLGLSEDACGATPACVFCNSHTKQADSKCYARREAEVLQHIFKTENGSGSFMCSAAL